MSIIARIRTRPAEVLLLLAGLMLAFAVATPVWAEDAKEASKTEDPPAPVDVDPVRTEPLHQTVPVIGRLVARKAGPVAARIGGPVGTIGVEVGDRVEAEQIIAVLVKDSFEWRVTLAEARVAEAEAAIKTARAEARLLSQELRRLEKLRKSAAFSQARLDDKRQELATSRSTIAETEAALASSKAELRLAEIDLYNADVRAPYAGVVSVRHTETGAFLTAGQPVVTLIDDQTLEIEADVPAERIGGLAPGTPVTFQLEGDRIFDASVRAAVPEENPLTRTRTVRFTPRFSASHTGLSLAANQSVLLSLPAGAARDVLSVHKDAILNRKGKSLVYVADNGSAKMRPVRLGEAVDGRFEVLSGLKAGELVVVRGNERLRPGQEITYGGGPAAPEGKADTADKTPSSDEAEKG